MKRLHVVWSVNRGVAVSKPVRYPEAVRIADQLEHVKHEPFVVLEAQ